MYSINRKDKGLLLPRVLIVSGFAWAKYPGCYYHPQKGELLYQGRFTPLDRGLIVVSEMTEWCRHGFASTLAHEWRHHWQWFNFPYRSVVREFNHSVSYREAIIEFFRNAKERDALFFSHEVEPCEETRLWKSWVEENA